jgi:succinoglycan biosynthesis protein ExoA
MKPKVSIIIPCRNEQATIACVLDAIRKQTFPQDQLEVIIADGLSSDGTRDVIKRYQKENPALAIKVIDNLKLTIPAALNAAIQASTGEIIVRLDGHAFPSNNYVRTCVEDLESNKGENVGGVWLIKPGSTSWKGRSIALAASNPFGVGDALYRYANKAGIVDTVPFGSFRKSLINEIGGFNENLLTNEDYEFNARIRQKGGKIWMDPFIKSDYIARGTYGELSRQYWRYGFWKNKMLRHNPRTLKWRQALPPIFILSILILILLSFGSEFARLMLLFEAGLYICALVAASLPTVFREKDLILLVGIPFSIATMHFFWGSGFLFSIISPGENK